ncbi:MAG: DUF308 domain-containing protein [Ruminococcaceae bacterium]|nr:DUF308 domain-containing protein [Oscillospiraceae bacterium]
MKKPEFIEKIKMPTIKKPAFLENVKKPTFDQKVVLTVAGALVIAGSVITVADYIERKRKDKVSRVGELIAGLAGVAIGALLASEPKRQETRKKLIVEDMFTEEDIAIADEQIRETLGNGADRGEPVAAPQRTVEVDDETSVEDFI